MNHSSIVNFVGVHHTDADFYDRATVTYFNPEILWDATSLPNKITAENETAGIAEYFAEITSSEPATIPIPTLALDE